MLNKENKKFSCCHGILGLVIVVLLALILIALVFKTGMIVSSSKTSYYHKDYSSQCDYKSKKLIIEQYEEKAEVMGMTVEEFKNYLIEQKKTKYEIFEVEAKSKGMTIEEYKKYLTDQKK